MKSPIDFTLLMDKTTGYAVHCPTAEDAALFVECAMRTHTAKCYGWRDGCTNYSRYGTDTVYTFHNKMASGNWRVDRLLYGSVGACSEMGYTIIEFSQICVCEELEESDQSISLLIGGCK